MTDAIKEISVIVPVYEQWHLVPVLLAALRSQTLAAETFEVVLVNNGPTAPPVLADVPAHCRLVDCAEPGSYAARNKGAAVTTGRLLVFTDADCVPAPQWLQALRNGAGTGDDALFAGAIEMFAVSPKPGASEIYDIVKGIPQERYATRGYGATANLLVPRRVFDLVGGFDAKRFSGGDAEFCRRAGRAGFPLTYLPQAVVRHPARTSWREIATKTRRIKGGQMQAGSAWYRRSLLFSLIPPVRGVAIFMRDRRHPIQRRLIASVVLFGLWTVSAREALRIRLGRQAERR